jgi:hypothetical protein
VKGESKYTSKFDIQRSILDIALFKGREMSNYERRMQNVEVDRILSETQKESKGLRVVKNSEW